MNPVLTRYLVKQGAYVSIKVDPMGRFNEGGISKGANQTYVNCREFLGRNGHNELYARMNQGGMTPNTNFGMLMGNGGGRGYVGYKVFTNNEEAIEYLESLGFDLKWSHPH